MEKRFREMVCVIKSIVIVFIWQILLRYISNINIKICDGSYLAWVVILGEGREATIGVTKTKNCMKKINDILVKNMTTDPISDRKAQRSLSRQSLIVSYFMSLKIYRVHWTK
ncbi:hypothetical protein QTP88_020036 [Uroleucon formosanum]